MRSNRSQDFNQENRSLKKPLLYDARGVMVKTSPLSNKWLRALLFYILPYIVINGIIFILVCYRPSITIDVHETTDYVTSEVQFTVHSILPVRELDVTLESEDLEYERSGNTYTTVVSQNGTFMVQVTAINGMQQREFVDIGLLDEMPPNLDTESAHISAGVLEFSISDNQSGVNFDTIYAVTDSGENLLPAEVDKTLGLVTINIPSDATSLDLYYTDMVGNEGNGHINLVSAS